MLPVRTRLLQQCFLALLLCLPGWTALAEPLEPAPEGSFTIAVIPDTQRYLGRNTKSTPDSTDDVTNPIFDAHIDWILENLELQRIVFVSHVGDIVDRNQVDQWEVAKRCLDRLHGRVPYGLTVGNHDMKASGDSTLFQQYFPAERFASFDWYGGCFPGDPDRPFASGNNANSYQLYSAEGLDFVHLHLECNAPDNVLAWADEVLTKYANRRAIVTTHMDLGPLEKPVTSSDFHSAPKGRMRWKKDHGELGNTPQEMWDKCFRKHANLFMICSGDQSRTSAYYLTTTGDHGNTVHALLSDYTSSGPMRLYRFLPAENAIDVITFDTTLRTRINDSTHVLGRENHQFRIAYEMSPQPAK